MYQRVKANTPEFLMFDIQEVEETEHMIFAADYILVWPRHCECTLHLGTSHYSLKPGQLVLLAPFNPFRIVLGSLEEGAEHGCDELHFRLNALGQTFVDSVQFSNIKKMLDQSRSGMLFDIPASSDIYTFLKMLENTFEFSQVLNLLSLLHKLSHVQPTMSFLADSFEIKNSQRIEDRVQIALKYIANNLAEPLSVSIVAEQLHMAESTFSRFFHANMGITFRQYIIEQRVRQAARYLVVTDWSIAHIGAEVGFSSLSNFNSKFKCLLKLTPKEYRSSHIDMRHNIGQHRSVEGQLQNQLTNTNNDYPYIS